MTPIPAGHQLPVCLGSSHQMLPVQTICPPTIAPQTMPLMEGEPT
jgi:hypothetical protein